MSNIIDLSYRIELNEETNEKKYFLNDEPWSFIDPANVKIGSMIYFDPNGLNRWGIVANIRESDFIYYDVIFPNSFRKEEIAMFQVYKVEEPNDDSNS